MRTTFIVHRGGLDDLPGGYGLVLRRTLNLGILAHVDAGKTTLTERLLYAAGVIDAARQRRQGDDADRLARARAAARHHDQVGGRLVPDRRRDREPDRHARPSGLHRRGGAGAERARRLRARDLGRRRRAAADADPDARAAAARRADAAVREQDRPRGRGPGARARRDRAAPDAGVVPMGSASGLGHASRVVRRRSGRPTATSCRAGAGGRASSRLLRLGAHRRRRRGA